MIRPVNVSDADQIAEIYNYYIHNTVVTFEEEAILGEEMGKRVLAAIADLPWLVYEQDGKILGYAYASEWKGRCAYRYTVETTIYLRHDAGGKGIGTSLYTQLIDQLADLGYHAIIGGIALPNAASVALHEKLGYQKVAQFKEVGFKFNKWVDVAYWQLMLASKNRS